MLVTLRGQRVNKDLISLTPLANLRLESCFSRNFTRFAESVWKNTQE